MVHHHDRSGTDPAYWDAWFQQQGFGPGRMKKLWLPHDAVAKTFATGRSTIEQFIDRGYTCDKVPSLSKQDGINALRLMIPYIEFSARCDDGLSALYSYKRRWNELTKQFTPEAVHDWSSNSADSARYMALVARQYGFERVARPRAAPKPEVLRPVEWKLDDLWSDYDKGRKASILRIR
jgi:hypothetical protein